MTSIIPTDHDVMSDFLGGEYREADPIWNFLRYKSGEHRVVVDKVTIEHIDQYILRDELAEIPAGFSASADTIASLWSTLVRAIELDSKDKYCRNSAQLGDFKYTTLEQFIEIGGDWCKEAASVAPDRRFLGVRLLLDLHVRG